MDAVQEMKNTIDTLGKDWNEFKSTMKDRDAEIAKLGKASGETEQKLARLNTALDASVEMKTRLEKIEAAMRRGGGSEEEQQKAEAAKQKAAVKQAFDMYFRKYNTRLIDEHAEKQQAEKKDLSGGSQPDGGYLVHEDMSGRIATRIYETSPIRALASVQAIGKGDTLTGVIDVDQAGVEWVGAQTTPTDQTTPQVGIWRIQAHEMATRPRATNQILEDADIDVEQWLINKISDRFARGEATAFVLGDGIAKPKGFMTYQSGTTWGKIEQVNSGAAAAITADGLISLQTALKTPYRQGSTWGMRRETIGTARKLKGVDNQYLWQPGLTGGAPNLLLGYPVVEMADLVVEGAGALAVVYGNFAIGYQIVDKLGLSILRDPFTAKPYVEFYARRRVGGAVVNFEALKIGKCAA